MYILYIYIYRYTHIHNLCMFEILRIKLSFTRDDDRLLEKYKTIWTNTEELQNIEFNASPVYDDRYMKTKIRTYGNKFRNLKVLGSCSVVVKLLCYHASDLHSIRSEASLLLDPKTP